MAQVKQPDTILPRIYVEASYRNEDGVDEKVRLQFRLRPDVAPSRAVRLILCAVGSDANDGPDAKKHLVGSAFDRIVDGYLTEFGNGERILERVGESKENGRRDMGSLRHRYRYMLGVRKRDLEQGRARFAVTFSTSSRLDERQVAFGELFDGEQELRMIERMQVDSEDRPRRTLRISDCGVVVGDKNDSANADEQKKEWPAGIKRRGRGSFKFVTDQEEDRGVSYRDQYGPYGAPPPPKLRRELPPHKLKQKEAREKQNAEERTMKEASNNEMATDRPRDKVGSSAKSKGMDDDREIQRSRRSLSDSSGSDTSNSRSARPR